MSHFNLENEINTALKLDAPMSKGPLPRWQRKALETSTSSNTSLNISANQSQTKTPSKTPKKSKKSTPGRNKTPKTPLPNGGDRFIGNRSATNFELSHFKVSQQDCESPEKEASPNKLTYQRKMSENLHGGDINNVRIVSYQTKAPRAPEGHLNSLRVLYTQTRTPSSATKSSRYIPHSADRILDAPDILDDYYLNLIDWSSQNVVAVALNNHVFLWNATTGNIEELLELPSPDYVSSLSWIQDGYYLAVGTSNREVQLYDVEKSRRLRVMAGQTGRVGSLVWNQYIVTSGSRRGSIYHHDVRVAEHKVGGIETAHTQEVCGLRWSPDARYLASGGNDNMLNVWPAADGLPYSTDTPLYRFNQHQSAVKALAWCPWQPSVLASGGGTADRTIKFWNCNTGSVLNSVDTKSQVCSILWSEEYKELISGHGFVNNQLIIWKYPTMTKVTELIGHQARVLNMAMSPDGTTIASVSADETLRLWKAFAVDPRKQKKIGTTGNASKFSLQSLR